MAGQRGLPGRTVSREGPSPEKGTILSLICVAPSNRCIANQSSPGAEETPTLMVPGFSLAALMTSAIVLYPKFPQKL